MKAGRLRHLLTIERPDLVPNGRGGRAPNPQTGGWVELATIRAEVIALRGDEAVRSGIERAKQLWRVTIRWRSDVTPMCRLVWGSIVMEITAAAPNDDGDGLVMTCESGVTGL